MKTKRIGWAIAVRGNTDESFIAVPWTVRTNRWEAIGNYYVDHKTYERRKRVGTAKTIPVYANEEDLK